MGRVSPTNITLTVVSKIRTIVGNDTAKVEVSFTSYDKLLNQQMKTIE